MNASTSFYLDTSVGRIHYKTSEDFSRDLPIVFFIHGAVIGSQHTEFWNDIMPIILRYCIPVRIDNFGHGLSDKVQLPFEERVRTTQQVIEKIMTQYPKKQFYLIGRSLGAMVVQSLLINYSPEIAAVGLIAPSRILTNAMMVKVPITLLWDINDPVAKFSAYSELKEQYPGKIALFTIGEHEDAVWTSSSTQPTHTPELISPELFERFLQHLLNSGSSVNN